VRYVGIRIHCHTVDLAQQPPQLLARIRALAERIAATVSLSLTSPGTR